MYYKHFKSNFVLIPCINSEQENFILLVVFKILYLYINRSNYALFHCHTKCVNKSI